MTINEILEVVIKHDPALAGFKSDSLPEAAKARVKNSLGSLERHFTQEEMESLEQWCAPGWEAAIFSADEQGCTYYVFADGSLYFASTGDSEVWTFASDFATDRIINGYEGPFGKMDAALLAHLGGSYSEIAEERGIAA